MLFLLFFFSCEKEHKAKLHSAECSIGCLLSQNAMLARVILSVVCHYQYDPSTMKIHTIGCKSPHTARTALKRASTVRCAADFGSYEKLWEA